MKILSSDIWGATVSKKIIFLFFTISILLLTAACRKSKNEITHTDQFITAVNKKENKNSIENTPEDVYHSLPQVNLPIEFSLEFLESFYNYTDLNENEYHLLTGIGDFNMYYERAFKAARLPPKDSLKFIITGYQSPNEEWILELYSLSDKLNPKDRLQIYSIEEIEEGSDIITQIFKIHKDYRIIVSKSLNGKTIEKLTYKPDKEGIFEEIRDGKTTTIAFESFDMKSYNIETFIWDYNPSGGLIKKDLKTENYKLNEKRPENNASKER